MKRELSIAPADWFLKVIDQIEKDKTAFDFSERQHLLGFINARYNREVAIALIHKALKYSELFHVNKISEFLNVVLHVNEYRMFHLLHRNNINVNDFGIEFDFNYKREDEIKLEFFISPKINDSLLNVRTVNQCIADAKNKAVPKKLFSDFWHEGELCILFADTNVGKSILAVQIANAISKGVPIHGFNHNADKQKVLYFDFEMSDKQFEKRYSQEYQNHYVWDDNFFRIEINPDYTDFKSFEKTLFESIERAIKKYQAKILIIDNLTYLKTQTTETAKEALPLMKLLKDLKLKHDLSILALAHTPKRDLAIPITRNHIAGSKHIANFADSVFAIGESVKDKSLRYLKQIKARATEMMYDSENVVVCEIAKPLNFLGFEFTDFGCEREHLKPPSENQKSELDASIIELKRSEPSISNAEIARRLNTNKMKVKRVLERNPIEPNNNT